MDYFPSKARELVKYWEGHIPVVIEECVMSLATQVEKLQAQLEAVGAGGVQRVRMMDTHSFLDLARLYCAVTETPSGDLEWSFRQSDMENLATEILATHGIKPTSTEG